MGVIYDRELMKVIGRKLGLVFPEYPTDPDLKHWEPVACRKCDMHLGYAPIGEGYRAVRICPEHGST